MRPVTAVVEVRPWLPRYQVTVLRENGSVAGSRRFWWLRNARSWVRDAPLEFYVTA